MAAFVRRILKQTGCMLAVDYGDQHAFSDSTQALSRHKFCSILERPGLVDITALVDFRALAASAMRCAYDEKIKATPTTNQSQLFVYKLRTQRDFLQMMGIDVRVQGAIKTMPADEAEKLRRAAERLTDPHGMGTEFKFMCVASSGCAMIVPSQKAHVPSLYPFWEPFFEERDEKRLEKEAKQQAEIRKVALGALDSTMADASWLLQGASDAQIKRRKGVEVEEGRPIKPVDFSF